MKKKNKILSLFLCAIVVLMGFCKISQIKAVTYPNELANIRKEGILNYTGFASLYYKLNDDYKIFCTTFHVENVGTTCSLSSKQWKTPVQAGVAAIIDKYNANPTKQNYYYAELAINEFLYYYSSKDAVNKISSSIEFRNLNGVKTFYDIAVKAYNNANKVYTIKLSTPNNKLNFKLDGKYYISDKITVSAVNGSTSGYKVSLSGVNGAEVYNKKGDNFYIRVPKSSIKIDSTVNVKINVSAKKTYKIAKKFSCNNNGQDITPNITTDYVTKSEAVLNGSITLKGNTIKIIKIDSNTKKAISGATLVIKNKTGKVVDQFTSSTSAYTLKNLEAGNYTIEETKAPKGYKLSSEKVLFEAKTDGKTIEVHFSNTKLPNKVEISKVDATTSAELPGAKLVVKDSKGKVIDSWTSTKEKHVIKDLKPGEYTLTETIAPKGYRLSTETVKFTVAGDGSTTKVTMKNYPKDTTRVKIIKRDGNTKKAIAGATLVVKDSNDNIVAEFVSTTEAQVIENLKVGKYTIIETKAPIGYELSTKKTTFTVANDDKTIVVSILNDKMLNKVEISKKDVTTGSELPGAELEVKDVNGKVIDSWTSTTEPHIIKDLKPGDYTLTETIAPNGYRLSTETVKFTVIGDGLTTKVVMYNSLKNNTVIKILKKDSETKENIPGATLVIKDAKGDIVKEFISTTSAHIIDDLKPGKYTLSETKAPNGYEISAKVIDFTVSNDDKTIELEVLNQKIHTEVEISKKDATTKEELPGAKLEVKDVNGKVIDSWTSTTESHIIKDLIPGEYTLTETLAPTGYKLSTETIKFNVKDDGSATKVVMYNSLKNSTIIKILKKDSETKENIAGATLVIKDANGNIVKEFVSTTSAHVINDLEVGKYTLSEIKAPEGYELSDKAINFTVSNDDKTIELEVLNTKKTEENRVEITKKDATTGSELPGARLEVKDANGNIIDSWTSTTEPHVIKNLSPGEYTLTETIAPTGYKLSTETIKFTVKADGSTTKVVMYNTKETEDVPTIPEIPDNQENPKYPIYISKQDITTKQELPGATLVIKDIKGNEITRFVSTTEPHYIELPSGDYTLTEIQSPNGYDLSYEVVKFTVSESNEASTVVMYNSKTPNTKDKNINLIISFMAFSLTGIGLSLFKIKKSY